MREGSRHIETEVLCNDPDLRKKKWIGNIKYMYEKTTSNNDEFLMVQLDLQLFAKCNVKIPPFELGDPRTQG